MKKPIEIANETMQMLLEKGADHACVVCSRGELREFNVDAGEFSLLRTTMENSLTLTAIKDDRRGSVSVNDLTQEAIESAVQDCMAAAESAEPDADFQFSDIAQDKEFLAGDIEPNMERLFLRSKELLETAKEDYPKVMLEQMIVSHRKSSSAYVNSNAIRYQKENGYYIASLMFSGRDGDKSSSFNGAGVMTASLDIPFIELGSIRQNLADAEKQVHTVPTKGKYEGTVVFTPDCLGGVISSLLDNYVSDGCILSGTSQWKDKLGQRVVDGRISILAAARHPDMVFSEEYTPEGFLTEDFDIIKDGVLENFILSNYVANKKNLKRSPNSGNGLIVKNGDIPLQELIGGIEKGLLVARFSGGNPNANGEFSGVAKNSFLIENGKITSAVSETMISGNLAGMLNQLRGISMEVVKNGISVMPWMAVDGVVISGK